MTRQWKSTVPRNLSGRAAGWVAGVFLLAAVPAVAGCSDDSSGAGPSAGAASAAASQPAPSQAAPSRSAPAPQGKAGGQPTARAVVGKWVAAVVANHLQRACMFMADADKGAPAKPSTPQQCGAGSKAQVMLGRLRKSLTPAHPGNPPKVKVAALKPSGGTVTARADQVTVDGKTLKAIMISNSSGPGKKGIRFGIKAGGVNGRWYVTGIKLSF